MIIKHSKKTLPIAILSAVLALLTLAILLFLNQPKSSAADISKFDPGNLMSDSVMSNRSSMNVQQIQAFLNSRNACNNTNVHLAQHYPHLQYNIRNGRFVCMAQDSFNGKSAAQIIWQAGQDYNINPQVLIVLLEKEQGLISDTWPNHIQYRTAAGFGCPDNIPAGAPPCEAQYFGLENQVRLAANLFRSVLNGGWSNYPVGRTFVQYHPNAACGGTHINIQNRATSALYRYTPYQPNQAALNAGYGTGDGCSAYGNRNFWRLFTDWFGSTQADRWTPLDNPRIMVTTKETYKINPDTNVNIQRLSAGTEIMFPTKTNLANNSGCLRTANDTRHNINACIRHSDLGEFKPNYVNIKPSGATQRKQIKQYTCKVEYKRALATNQCLNPGVAIDVIKEVSAAGDDYYVTTHDWSKKASTAFRIDRLEDIPQGEQIETLLTKKEQIQKNTQYTCKVNLLTFRADERWCFKQSTSINFTKSIIINGEKYLITEHDDKNGIKTAFLAKRFTAE